MKNLFLALIFIVGFLPRVAFGANAQLDAFNKQQDAESVAFFQQQADDRAAFIKQHPDIFAKLDQQGSQTAGQNSSTASSTDTTLSQFEQKQLGDKQAFLTKLAQDRQKFLSTQTAQ